MTNAQWGDTFLNRFDWKVRNAGRVKHPVSGEEIRLEQDIQAQCFRRTFGEVAQFLIRKERLHLAAIRLEEPGPGQDVLRQIAGPEGLDFEDEKFYCVGVFSPADWPEQWKDHAEVRSNALFYLVEKGEGTSWRVFGPRHPLQDLFDPESFEEKKVRAHSALAGGAGFRTADQIELDSFLQEHSLDRAAVEGAIQSAPGRFLIIEHKGKSYIQRFTR